jgi:metallo-beta-lactamase class B
MPLRSFALVIAMVASTAQGRPPLKSDPPVVCEQCAAWNAPHEPFRIFGNTYYVGTAGLSAVLISSDDGLVLLDGALPQSAPLIDRNIRTLGFRTEDIRLILNSHAHYDHAGAIAALQRVSGAIVASSPAGARALEQGNPGPDDPQAGSGAFPAVKNVRIVADGEVLRIGPLDVAAHFTPGHTPGSTTWTWQSCEGSKCLNIVYADSLTAVSRPGFRFTGDTNSPSRIESFRASIAKVAALPCDIMLSTHPEFSELSKKLSRREKEPSINPFIDAAACRVYAAGALKGLERRIADER